MTVQSDIEQVREHAIKYPSKSQKRIRRSATPASRDKSTGTKTSEFPMHDSICLTKHQLSMP